MPPLAARFARLEQRINAAVQEHLVNAVATFGASEPFGVVFDSDLVEAFNLVEGCSATASFDRAKAPGLHLQGLLVIDGAAWRVIAGMVPDSSGWVTVQLREA